MTMIILYQIKIINKTQTTIQVLLPNGDTTADNITQRFPLGSYLQVDEEIIALLKIL